MRHDLREGCTTGRSSVAANTNTVRQVPWTPLGGGWRRLSALALMVMLLTAFWPGLGRADQAIGVVVDGTPLQLDVAPVVESGRTLVPLRAVMEALGASVHWDAGTQTVTATRGAGMLRLTIGSAAAWVGQQSVTLSVPARIIDGRTFVPLRFVGEALGDRVDFDPSTRTVTVTSAAPTTPPPVEGAPAAPAPMPDPVTGLVTVEAYDGKVNLSWAPSNAAGLTWYNVYAGTAPIIDVTGMTPLQQVRASNQPAVQLSGLDAGVPYYFAVTAGADAGRENTRVTSTTLTPKALPRGTVDPDFTVGAYRSDLAWNGTTLLADQHNPRRPRIVEVNMLGEIIWQWVVPDALRGFTNPGFSVKPLPNGNVLALLPGYGALELDRSGKTVWSYLDAKVSHDAERLASGNTLVVFGNNDTMSDTQAKEVDPKGDVVWSWQARDYFEKSIYKDVSWQGWTHTNAATRLAGGNTLVSLRNFHLVVEVDPKGVVVRTIGKGVFVSQHDPQMLPNGHLLLANQVAPPAHWAIEYDLDTGKIVWAFPMQEVPMRDANRLPNGNTLIVGSSRIIEVTPDRQIVWDFQLRGIRLAPPEASGLGFYKAERISASP